MKTVIQNKNRLQNKDVCRATSVNYLLTYNIDSLCNRYAIFIYSPIIELSLIGLIYDHVQFSFWPRSKCFYDNCHKLYVTYISVLTLSIC